MTAWSLHGLRQTYRAFARPPHVVLRDASLEVAAGERVGLAGPSGCGKTTLVRCGLGLRPIEAGRISVLGEDTSQWARRRWQLARHQVQLLVQDPVAMLHPRVSIHTLLLDSARLHRPDEPAHHAVAQALEQVRLTHRADALPHQLSGGEQRRAGLARVLLARPKLLVCDEPTAGLDAHLRLELMQLLFDQVDAACAVVVVSHDVAALAAMCDRVAVMHEGSVVESIDAVALREGTARPTHPAALEHLHASGWRAIAEVAP